MLKVTYTKSNVHTFDEIRLLPGLNILNKLTPEQEKAFLSHPDIKEKIKKGVIVVHNSKTVRAEPAEGVENENPDDEIETGDEEFRTEDDENDGEGDETDEEADEDTADPRPVKEILEDLGSVVDISYLRALTNDKRVTVAKAAQKRLDKVIEESNPAETKDGETV